MIPIQQLHVPISLAIGLSSVDSDGEIRGTTDRCQIETSFTRSQCALYHLLQAYSRNTYEPIDSVAMGQ